MSASSEGGAGGAVGGSAGGTATTTAPAAHSTVAAKITHVKADGGISITGTPIISGGTIKVATGGNTVQTSLSGTPIALNTGQATTAASIRAIGAGGQSTQVRVVMPMIKQLENVTATGRTQITAIPATPARSVSNASITVTRPVTQATYLPRASVTATHMSGVGVTGAQRLVTPLRATSTASVSPAPTGLSSTGNFVRTSQPSTVISSANSTATAAWMQSNTGQVQLIRAIHQPRQRIITTSAGVTGANVSTTATPVQTPTSLTVSAAQPMPPQPSGPTGIPQAYVATVLPPRQHQATLVYSSNMSAAGSPNTIPNQQFNPRFAVATPIGSATSTATTPGGTTVTPRQVRPIPLGKSFPATKLNTTSISIRAPSIPQLNSNVAPPTPVSVSGGVTVAGRGPGGTGAGTNVAPVALTAANLPTTRIIQLQQPATGGAHQIIGSTTRLAPNVMLQPFLMSTSAAAKMGIRPPVTMTAKVQPSLTITQLSPIGKLSTAGGAGGPTMAPQGVASIQAVPSVSGSGTPSSVSGGSSAAVAAAGGATVLPLTIGGRGGPASNILTGTLTPIKNASGITVGKMMMTQSAGVDVSTSSGLTPAGTATNVFIQQRSGGGSGVSVSATAATSVATSSTGTSFLPPGSSAIYYESMPASTGVLSLTTTTVTQSTHTHGQTHAQAQAQAQLVSSSGGSSLSVSSLPFASHAQQVGTGGGSTATFTVLPSSAAAGGNRTIGHQQLIIPAGAAHAAGGQPQHMVIPLHTSVKVTTGAVPTTTGGGATVSALPMPVPVAANTLVSSFMRKRDAEGSPIRGVKNLAPTLLSMSSNSNASATVGNVTAVNLAGGSAFNLQPVTVTPAPQPPTTTAVSSALTVEALAKKERERVSSAVAAAAAAIGASSASTASISTTAGSIVSTRNVRAESPASSDGSTTVSANSSPGVDQQMQDSNLSINRIGDEPTGTAVRDNATHFNPINELYSSHQSPLPQNVTHTTLGARGSGVASAFVDVPQQQASHLVTTQATTLTASQLQQARMNGTGGNGSNSDYGLARKKPRRSTNDSQHSNQSQASLSLSLPPPMGSVSSHSSSTTQETAATFTQQQQQQQHNNGGLLVTAAGSAATTPNASAGDVNNHRVAGSGTPAVAGNKENANPVDFVLRRPRNCALLNTYKPTHKLANNHFHRYTDVKPRDERRATVIDLANQPNVQKKISGWKIHHLRSQMEDLNDSEMVSLSQLETMLKVLEKDKDKLGEIERISELLKGNIQRSKIITDGINEAQNQLMKIFDHKPHVSDIINRLQSKRNFKKREKL
ncbi:pneumococcal serine-rich repeat protein isoform X2 [Drosophila montana]|uniref:pneumococcal serine-rich repeat protein isoform X2 n=1 Tax=Drosophila montana TaxID=40370 RepID=UPI00313E9D88